MLRASETLRKKTAPVLPSNQIPAKTSELHDVQKILYPLCIDIILLSLAVNVLSELQKKNTEMNEMLSLALRRMLYEWLSPIIAFSWVCSGGRQTTDGNDDGTATCGGWASDTLAHHDIHKPLGTFDLLLQSVP